MPFDGAEEEEPGDDEEVWDGKPRRAIQKVVQRYL
jgi:hypothetical protein